MTEEIYKVKADFGMLYKLAKMSGGECRIAKNTILRAIYIEPVNVCDRFYYEMEIDDGIFNEFCYNLPLSVIENAKSFHGDISIQIQSEANKAKIRITNYDGTVVSYDATAIDIYERHCACKDFTIYRKYDFLRHLPDLASIAYDFIDTSKQCYKPHLKNLHMIVSSNNVRFCATDDNKMFVRDESSKRIKEWAEGMLSQRKNFVIGIPEDALKIIKTFKSYDIQIGLSDIRHQINKDQTITPCAAIKIIWSDNYNNTVRCLRLLEYNRIVQGLAARLDSMLTTFDTEPCTLANQDFVNFVEIGARKARREQDEKKKNNYSFIVKTDKSNLECCVFNHIDDSVMASIYEDAVTNDKPFNVPILMNIDQLSKTIKAIKTNKGNIFAMHCADDVRDDKPAGKHILKYIGFNIGFGLVLTMGNTPQEQDIDRFNKILQGAC